MKSTRVFVIRMLLLCSLGVYSTSVALAVESWKKPIPVTWGITKTQFKGRSHSTQSESFQETWTLVRQGQAVYLKSPRKKVKISSKVLNSNLNLKKRDLLLLLGFKGDLKDSKWDDLIPLTAENLKYGQEVQVSANVVQDEHWQINFGITVQETSP